MTSRLPVPESLRNERPRPSLWLDEAIWGHRLYDEQVPWLALLECLGVALAEHKVGRLFTEPVPNTLRYVPNLQIRLRYLLFSSPQVQYIAAGGRDDDTCWQDWLASLKVLPQGLSRDDFASLRSRFASFQDFARVIGFLRGATVEGPNNKRWTSQFLFPYGPTALYEDLDTKLTIDRRFYARTGELLYLMLSRSSFAGELRAVVASRLLSGERKFNQLLSVLQGTDHPYQGEKANSYLPYPALPAYESLAEDWLRLLARSLPEYDVLPHLVTITGLHLLLYLLTRSVEELAAGPLRLVVEIVAPRKTVVREASADSFADNERLSERAIEHSIETFTREPEWRDLGASADDLTLARELLGQRFWWPEHDDLDGVGVTPADLVRALKERAVTRHRQHVGKVHRSWGRAIGLVSSRSSRRTRYAFTDGLIKSLVMCVVDDRMPFDDFVRTLHQRYGFVIGAEEAAAETLTRTADSEPFEDNKRRLEQRLASLGLVRRLSDQCAFVLNPFAQAKS